MSSPGVENALFPEDPGATYGSVLPLKRNPDGSLSVAWPGAIHDLVNMGYNALVGPGETLTGRTPTGNQLSAVPDPQKLAADITGTMMTLGVGAPAPAGASRVFGGPLAKTADLQKLEMAKAMEGHVHPQTVFERTGWFKDVDGSWKFEIPDTGAKFSPRNVIPAQHLGTQIMLQPGDTLGSVVQHSALYEAYPGLAKIPLKPADANYLGSYDPDVERIGLGTPHPETALSTLLHESQHAIQHREGFAGGGSPQDFLPSTWSRDWSRAIKDLDYMRGELENKFGPDQASDLEMLMSKAIDGKIHPVDYPMIGDFAAHDPENFSLMQSILRRTKYLNSQRKAAQESYEALAGEVEARNVQERLASGAYETHPHYTPGYPTYPQDVKPALPLVPVGHNPFGVPVEHDPFALTPVDHNPFEEK